VSARLDGCAWIAWTATAIPTKSPERRGATRRVIFRVKESQRGIASLFRDLSDLSRADGLGSVRLDLSRVASHSPSINESTKSQVYRARNEGRGVPSRRLGSSAFRHFGISVRLARWQSQQRVTPWINELIAVVGRRKFLSDPVYRIRLTSRRAIREMLRLECQKFQEAQEKWRMVPFEWKGVESPHRRNPDLICVTRTKRESEIQR